jgi:hypothetical protein
MDDVLFKGNDIAKLIKIELDELEICNKMSWHISYTSLSQLKWKRVHNFLKAWN